MRHVAFLLLTFAVISSALLAETLAEAKPDADRVAQQVDRLLAEELFSERTKLAPRTSDATYLRRVWLDLVGDIPTPEHLTAFLLDPSDEKRQQVVHSLLAHPQFGQNWARYWRDAILARRKEDRSMIVSNTLVTMLSDDLNSGKTWDKVADKFITSLGDVQENGATAIMLAQEGSTEESTAEISRLFLGIQIQCAQCHDHPYDRWKREQFHELAAFFPRTAVRQIKTPQRRSFAIFANDRPDRGGQPSNNLNRRGNAEHYMPNLDDPKAAGTKMQPRFFLTGAEIPFGTSDKERRKTIAEWFTNSEWFATAYVNRMWAELVGEGFYEPIDDIGPDRTPTAPKAIAYLSEQFAKSGHDPKWLYEVICQTDAYQRESRPRRLSTSTPFTANVAQRLRGDQLFNSLLTTLEIEETKMRPIVNATGGRGYRGAFAPRMSFNSAFGFDPSVPRETITGSIPQALALMNTPQMNRAISVGSKRQPTSLGKLIASIEDDRALTSELYLRTVCREPTTEELDYIDAYLPSAGSRAEAYEDLLWTLINSVEYIHRK